MKALVLFFLLLISLQVKATIYTVINTNDGGAGSLRQAIFNANSNDTVTFDAVLVSGGNNVIILNSEIEYSKSLTIIGLMTQTDTLFVSGNFSSRIFKILGGASKLDKMAIINGYTTGYGGGIYADCDSLKVINSVVKGNTSSGVNYAVGGGIYTRSRLDIINSIITKNSTYSNRVGGSSLGGGIYSDADTLLIENSTISYNTVVSDSSTSRGGGVYSNSSLNVINSTFNSNSVLSNEGSNSSDGGGIYITSSANTLTLLNTTITGNTASGYYASYGGGVVSSATSTYVNNSTISKNTVSGASFSSGGGVYFLYSSLSIGSSIIALNNGGADVYGTLSNNYGYNIFSDAPSIYIGSDQINMTNSDIKLGVLQNNGGSTNTLMPGIGSVAIDMGTPSDVSDAQNGPIVGRRDVGAAEYILQCDVDSTTINENICQGSTYSFNNQTLSLAGLYYDTLVNSGGCDSIITLNLSVNLLPTVNINQNGVSLQATSGYVDYVWTYNSSLIIGADSNEYTPTQNGTYLVRVTDTNGCENSTSFNFNTLSTDDLKLSNDISIYPNPTQGEVYIKSFFDIKSIVIYDYHGREVVTYNNTPQKLDFYGFKKGNYLIKIIDEKDNQFIERVTVIN